MNYDTFVDQVAQRAQAPYGQAVELTRATLQTLADRLTGGEALDLAAQLPRPLQQILTSASEPAHRFGAAEFILRVSERADVDQQTARAGIRAVFTALRESISSGEFDDVMAQLPRDYRDMVEPVMAPRATAPRRA